MVVFTKLFDGSGSVDSAAALVRGDRPWGFELDATRSAALVAVTRGTCWLRRLDAPRIALVPGELALVPTTLPGDGLATSADGDLVPYEAMFGPQVNGTADNPADDGAASSVVYVAYEPSARDRPLLTGLPGLVVVGGEAERRRDALGGAISLLSAEIADDCPKARTAISRLVDVLVVYVLRACDTAERAARADTDGAWPSAASVDSAVASALERMHAEPARRLTIGRLAAEVGLSRAAFVRRFGALVGEPPSTYLTRLRLATAARLLRETTVPLATIAREVGYSSEFTFSRAFHRAHGQPPGRYRADLRRGRRQRVL